MNSNYFLGIDDFVNGKILVPVGGGRNRTNIHRDYDAIFSCHSLSSIFYVYLYTRGKP